MSGAVDGAPIGKVVVVGIGVVHKTTVLSEQPPGVHRRPITAVPTGRLVAEGAFEALDRGTDLLAFLVGREGAMVDPAVAMTAHVVASVGDCGRDRGVAFECQRASEHRQRERATLKLAVDSEEPRPASVLEQPFGGKIPGRT